MPGEEQSRDQPRVAWRRPRSLVAHLQGKNEACSARDGVPPFTSIPARGRGIPRGEISVHKEDALPFPCPYGEQLLDWELDGACPGALPRD